MKKMLQVSIICFGLVTGFFLTRVECSPLHLAIDNEDWQQVITLVKNGADVNEENEDGETPINVLFGIEPLEEEIALFLLKNGLDVNSKGKFPDLFANILTEAVVYGQYRLAKALIDQGADVNVSTSNGATAISRLAGLSVGLIQFSKKIQLMKLLIENDADINIPTVYGQSILAKIKEQKNELMSDNEEFFEDLEESEQEVYWKKIKDYDEIITLLIEKGAKD